MQIPNFASSKETITPNDNVSRQCLHDLPLKIPNTSHILNSRSSNLNYVLL
jgi:hypothetical protein